MIRMQGEKRRRTQADTDYLEEAMFALDIKKVEAHERELNAVSRLETRTPTGEIVLLFFHAGEGWSDRAFIESVSASDFSR